MDQENLAAMISVAAAAAPQQRRELVTALIRKMSTLIINRFRSASASLLPPQPTSEPITTLLPEEEVYIRGSGDRPDEDDLLQCVICLYEVIRGEKYRVLPDCKHGFHIQCIDAWLQKNASCPLCRCPVPYASMKNNEGEGDEEHQALHDDMLSCVLAFFDHFCRWFVNPLGFDDESPCDQAPNYAI